MEMHNVDEQPMAQRSRNVEERQIAQNKSSESWPFSFFAFDKERDSPDGVRNALLVVAALFAAASFQGMTSPPDSIKEGPHIAKLLFTCSITLAWSASMSIIIMLTSSFPFKREIFFSYYGMMFTFGISAGSLGGVTGSVPYILFIFFSLLPWLFRWIPHCIKSAC